MTEAHPKLLLHARQREFGALAQDFGLTVEPKIITRGRTTIGATPMIAALAAREGFGRSVGQRDLACLPPILGRAGSPRRIAQLAPVQLLVVPIAAADECSVRSAAVGLRCVVCGRGFALDYLRGCPECRGLVFVEYDLGRVAELGLGDGEGWGSLALGCAVAAD